MLPALHPEMTRHKRRMTSSDDGALRDLNRLICDLHAARVWEQIDTLCVVSIEEVDSLLDLKGLVDSAAVNSPVFTADAGFDISLAASSYINSNFHKDVVGAQFSVGDASMFLWENVPGGTDPQWVGGANDISGVDPHNVGYLVQNGYSAGPPATYSLCLGYIGYISGANLSSVPAGGFSAVSRWLSTLRLKFGTLTTETAAASFSAPDRDLYVGCANDVSAGANGFCDGSRFCVWGFGKDITLFKLEMLRAALSTYLTARGAI